jgi:predicted nucleic acid-binding protein
VTLDTGGLVAIERNNPVMRRLIELAIERKRLPTVPTAVVVEAWRGGRSARLARALRHCWVEPLGEDLARRAGELLARTHTSDPVDAVVAQSAAVRGDIVLTSDPDDLQVLADELRTIRVRRI